MINYLDPHEAPTFEKVLQRMSEDGRCLLTGEKGNLTYFPVDTNPQNFLPSNMACISNGVAQQISYTYFYEVDLWDFKLTFDTPPIFADYNTNVLEIIKGTKLQEKEKYSLKPESFAGLFEFLTMQHAKGVYKISYSVEGCEYWMDSAQYQGYLLRLLANEKAKKSNIITSPSLGIVK